MSFNLDLGKNLKDQIEVVKALRDLAYAKTDLIMENKLEDLSSLTKREGDLINSLALLEENRLRLLDLWGVEINTPISHIIDKLPEGREEILHIKDSLSSLMEDLDTRNKLNGDLIRENLEWIDFNMNLLMGPGPSGYGEGKTQEASKIFDRKV